jgi:aldehyde dehydrogenase (NAD+)
VGTIAVVTPANNPVYIPLSKLVPAMLYGNSAIWKPAEEVTAISQQIIIAMSKVQWPQSLVQLREGGRHEADKLFNDPSVDAVTITGSEAAGEAARTVCARRNIPLQAELGGNNAALVWDDADLNAAAQAIAGGAFDMAGQRCTANRRVIVHQDCMDRFLPLLVSATRELGWGDPLSPETRVGPLLTPSRCQRVASAVERAAEHASCIFPLSSLSPQTSSFTGCWFPPTIIRCDDAQAEIVQEETFGPVLVVQSANEWD